MKKVLTMLFVLLMSFTLLAGCGKDDSSNTLAESPAESESLDSQDRDEPEASEAEDTKEADELAQAPEDAAPAEEAEETPAAESLPDGEIVDGALATQENPVPVGTWAKVTVSDGGWPKFAYVRISNVITDQAQTQALIDEHNETSNDKVPALKEHSEFLDYIAVEYEIFFPENFTDSETIAFSNVTFSRQCPEDEWIASDGSNYYWMGGITVIEWPTGADGHPKNGETVKGEIVYPMIKGKTDYTLYYKERTEDLESYIETYFAVN